MRGGLAGMHQRSQAIDNGGEAPANSLLAGLCTFSHHMPTLPADHVMLSYIPQVPVQGIWLSSCNVWAESGRVDEPGRCTIWKEV